MRCQYDRTTSLDNVCYDIPKKSPCSWVHAGCRLILFREEQVKMLVHREGLRLVTEDSWKFTRLINNNILQELSSVYKLCSDTLTYQSFI